MAGGRRTSRRPGGRRPRRQLADRRDADPRRILAAFREAGAEFVVIGGVAALAHGVQRITRDFDILIAPREENCARVITALAALGAEECLASSGRWARVSPKASPAWLLERPRFFDSDAGGIDLCNAMEGVPAWDEAVAGSIEISAFGQSFRILDKDTLIRSKLAAARPKDLADVTELNELDAQSRDQSRPPPRG